jgi:hypothetical protein
MDDAKEPSHGIRFEFIEPCPSASPSPDTSFQIVGGISSDSMPEPPTPSPARPSSSASEPTGAAARMRQSRWRRKRGYRCLRLDIHEDEIAALVERKLLDPESRNDPDAVINALYDFLERELVARNGL